jgi:quinol monooxygenase YgiN
MRLCKTIARTETRSMNFPFFRFKAFLITLGGALALSAASSAFAQTPPAPYVRLAELQVDAARLADFEAAATAHVAVATRVEPGILAFHTVSEKGQPTHVRVFEMYESEAAYQAHLQTPHFKAFAAATQDMLVGRQLFDVVPVRLGSKKTLPSSSIVRVADLEILPAQLNAYRTAVSEEINDSIRLEPGVAAIYSVSLKDTPEKIRFLEIYADDAAYRQHIASPHFRKYVDLTKEMIAQRRLLETESTRLYIKAP